MAVKQNAFDFTLLYLLVAKVVNESFYVDDCLADANSVGEVIETQAQLHDLLRFSTPQVELQ